MSVRKRRPCKRTHTTEVSLRVESKESRRHIKRILPTCSGQCNLGRAKATTSGGKVQKKAREL
ncbi:hypothetical protein RR48_04568 [Papilio machaon]|uniref:Uncharacterized protein n=1 Tax=Papilio machaon TaxID=76193 RepID=A0A0N1ICN7_PAPMA|nr:hypothetical protein RR48_04568 [Papilio machaon]